MLDAHALMATAFASVGVVLVATFARSTVEQPWFLPFGAACCVASVLAFVLFPVLCSVAGWPLAGGVADAYAMLSDLPDFGIVLIGAWLLNRFVLSRK